MFEIHSKLSVVVEISLRIFFSGLFFVDAPVIPVHNVLVEILSTRQMQESEPLVSDVVILHRVLLLPVRKRAAKVHSLEPWTSVVVVELPWPSLLVNPVEFRFDLLRWMFLLALLGAEVKVIKLVLFFSFLTENLIENINWAVGLRVPFTTATFDLFFRFMVEVYLFSEAVKLG
jgi:hypothetical protein